MDHLPILLNVKGHRALVVGGGTVAARKTDLLVRAGCDITVIAPQLNDDMARLVHENGIEHRTDEVVPKDLDGCTIAFGATSDRATNRKLSEFCQSSWRESQRSR